MDSWSSEERTSNVFLHQEQKLPSSANCLPSPGNLGDNEDTVGRKEIGFVLLDAISLTSEAAAAESDVDGVLAEIDATAILVTADTAEE